MPDLTNTIRVAVARHCAKTHEQYTVKVTGDCITITRTGQNNAVPSDPGPTKEQFVGYLDTMEVSSFTLGSQYASRYKEFEQWIDEFVLTCDKDITYQQTDVMTVTRYS
jgi:hypothetical protein